MGLLPIAVGLLLLVAALLAASETALFSLVRMESARDRLHGSVRAALDRLMSRPLESLLVIIGLNETANIFAECLATSFLLYLFGRPLGAYVSVPLMFVLVLLICEITPKTFALGWPDGVARLTARPLAALTTFVHPIVRRFSPFKEAPRPTPLSESEFRALLRVSESQGEVEPAERALIDKVFEFANRRVSDVMTPREKIFCLDINTPPENLVAEVAHGHFSRVPVYRNDPGTIVGVLHVKDLVARRLEATLPRLERLIRPPFFVPPSKPLAELFEQMRRERCQLAIVVDEYGVLLGVLSLEDMLEELFGEISDEFDIETPELTRESDGSWLAAGAIEFDKLREALGRERLPAPDGKATLSRWILRSLGRVPRPGERLRLGEFDAAIEKVRGASVELVRLTPWA
ncbi:MAG: hemolysin family protein [Candidatus Binataceae bacterium]|jgi:putative hemolysin